MSELAARETHFEEVISRLPFQLDQLVSAPAMPRLDHPVIPKGAAIYLFSERPQNYLYVGQTRTLQQRLRQHTIPSAPQNQASFAFRIAVDEAQRDQIMLTGNRDEQALQLGERFGRAKRRVAAMDVQFIEMDDPIERTIFEMYTALHLGTEEYNSFETH